jgi:hypothetical protein
MSNDEHRFLKIINKLPVDNDNILGLGLQYFISNQDPEEVRFVEYNNGYAIEIATDEDNVDEARGFWEEYIQDKI